MKTQALDITGDTYGEWTAIRSLGRARGNTRWECRCSCGTLHAVILANLRNGTSTRCRQCADRRRRAESGEEKQENS